MSPEQRFNHSNNGDLLINRLVIPLGKLGFTLLSFHVSNNSLKRKVITDMKPPVSKVSVTSLILDYTAEEGEDLSLSEVHSRIVSILQSAWDEENDQPKPCWRMDRGLLYIFLPFNN